jgi:tetratricopeptide (TPR) repeat protein
MAKTRWISSMLLGMALALGGRGRADFLPDAGPIQSMAMGGNLVALPGLATAEADNPAALADLDSHRLAARYQALYPGLSSDNLGTQGLSLLAPTVGFGGLGLDWDHFGSSYLEQDRFRLADGLGFPSNAYHPWCSAGVAASYLHQSYTLSTPLAGVDPGRLSADAWSMDLGLAWRPWPALCLAGSVQDLNQPNLGVLGVERLPVTSRWGLGLDAPAWRLTATLAQTLEQGQMESHAGVQWSPAPGLDLRCGVNTWDASVGLGFRVGPMALDYGYAWSIAPGPSGQLPGNQALELSYAWAAQARGQGLLKDLAQDAAEQGRLAEAIALYSRAAELDPKDQALVQAKAEVEARYQQAQSVAYANAGRQAEAQGEAAEALADYRWAIHLAPGSAEDARAVARIEASLPRGPMADPRFQAQLQAVLDALAAGQRGQAGALLSQLQRAYPQDTALVALERSLKAPAKLHTRPPAPDTDTLNQMEEAMRYAAKGQGALALQTWQAVLKRDPDNPLALRFVQESAPGRGTTLSPERKKQADDKYNAGLAAYQAGDLAKAVELWSEAARLDPSNLDAQNNLLRAKVELEQKRQ